MISPLVYKISWSDGPLKLLPSCKLEPYSCCNNVGIWSHAFILLRCGFVFSYNYNYYMYYNTESEWI